VTRKQRPGEDALVGPTGGTSSGGDGTDDFELEDAPQLLVAPLPRYAPEDIGERLAGQEPPLRYRRGPRRTDVVTYRVRADLKGTRPPTLRRLEMASDLNLAEVHDILQVAFGWTDSHLHGFAAGPEFYSDQAERYLCPFDERESEADEGVPEVQVRLDEVLAERGDMLAYTYDYGDDWEHLLTLEAVLSRGDDAPRAVCTGGERDGPAEDCGGVDSYELIAAATDPASPGHADAVLEFAEIYGDEVDPEDFRPTPFDIDQVNAVLGRLGPNPAIDVASLPAPLRELLQQVRSTDGLRTLRQLIAAADLSSPLQVDPATAERMVRPYAWLLDRVGASGIRLTSAGYLPPVHVAAAFTELGLEDEWIGRGNREVDTWPVLHLRESAQKLGLLRKYRGELRRTARGDAAREDPVALWRHLAERMPVRAADPFEAQAGLLILVAVAGGLADKIEATVADILGSIGWMLSDGTPPSPTLAFSAARETYDVLRRVGAIAEQRGFPSLQAPTPEGVVFARAALRNWPKERQPFGTGRSAQRIS